MAMYIILWGQKVNFAVYEHPFTHTVRGYRRILPISVYVCRHVHVHAMSSIHAGPCRICSIRVLLDV